MVTVNIHEAKTQLSKLVDRAAKGIVAVTVAAQAVLFIREAEVRNAFRLQTFESRFERAGGPTSLWRCGGWRHEVQLRWRP